MFEFSICTPFLWWLFPLPCQSCFEFAISIFAVAVSFHSP
jgi:hypothetical protein